MKFGSSKLQEKLQPEIKKAEIDPRFKQGVYYAKEASHVAVKVSGFLGKQNCCNFLLNVTNNEDNGISQKV